MNASNPLMARDTVEAPERPLTSGYPLRTQCDAEPRSIEINTGCAPLLPVEGRSPIELLRDFRGNFSLSHLSAFMAVLETGRITAASALLSRSHSAISRSIGILEDKLKCALLVRSPNGVTPTAKGEACNARCKIIKQELNDLRDLLIQSGHAGLGRRSASLFGMHVDVSRLKAVVAVHDFRSVQNAAHFLAVSQPAVSSSIRGLEKDLGIALFVRTPGGTIPTPAGVSITMSFKRILSELRKIDDDTASVDGASSGVVCVGGLAYSRNALLPQAIKHVLVDFPHIVVRTVEGPIDVLLAAFRAGDIDILICARPNPALLEGIIVEPIVRDRLRLFVCGDHPLANRKNISAQDIIRYPFILPPVGTVTRKLLDTAFQVAAGRLPQGSVETSSHAIIRNLLVGTQQISFRSVLEFSHDLSDKRIVQLDAGFDLPVREICILQRKGAVATCAVAEVIKIIRQVAAARAETIDDAPPFTGRMKAI